MSVVSRRTFVKGLAAGVAARRARRESHLRALRAGRAPSAGGAARHLVRSVDRRSADELHRLDEDRADHQRIDSRPAAAVARRRHRDAARRQSARRGHVDSLARHRPAGRHGRRARPELPRHPPARVLHLSLRGQAVGHLLVSQPFGLPGAARRLWAARHRSARAGSDRVRSRARDPAVGLDRRGSRARLQEAEEAIRLLQLPQAHARRLLQGRAQERARRDDRGSIGVGRDAHEPDRSRRRRRAPPTPT